MGLGLLASTLNFCIKMGPLSGASSLRSLIPFLQIVEQKGLDIVRRDWCPLSKDAGNFALDQILSGQPKEDVVNAVHAKLAEVKEKMEQGLIALHKFVITKQLTKKPSDYPDAQNQPHVQVALRRIKQSKRDGVAQVS